MVILKSCLEFHFTASYNMTFANKVVVYKLPYIPSTISNAVTNGPEKVCVTFIIYIGACIPVYSVLWLKK